VGTAIEPPAKIADVTVSATSTDGSTREFTTRAAESVTVETEYGFYRGGAFVDEIEDPFGWPSEVDSPTHVRVTYVFPIRERAIFVKRRWAEDEAVDRIAELEARLAAVQTALQS
jgi:hypothetical protein